MTGSVSAIPMQAAAFQTTMKLALPYTALDQAQRGPGFFRQSVNPAAATAASGQINQRRAI